VTYQLSTFEKPVKFLYIDIRMIKKTSIELLSPAKDLAAGIAAINYGADAVYIGASRFGARSAAGNSLSDIAKLIEYAHHYRAKVYITLNTILYDDELDEALTIARSVYDAGADALIIQDMGLLEMDLPPIPLFASTQTHNYNLAKIQFLEKVGFKRIILARELSLKQLKEIRANTSIDLEFFIHGALCVSFSGQCYLSEATQSRSANRGECAQPCRLPYNLLDANGKILERDKYLLSLKDLNLSEYLKDLIDAGVTSFKIEGRLKDISYVKNVTAFYRKRIDEIIEKDSTFKRASSGKTYVVFQPDPAKSFNRGFTEHFIQHRSKDILASRSPKSIGAYIGKVEKVGRDYFVIDSSEQLHNGDGICFFDSTEELQGTNINKAEGKKIFPSELDGIQSGSVIYRNYDHLFTKELQSDKTKRLIEVRMSFKEVKEGFVLKITDEDGIEVSLTLNTEKHPAKNGKTAEETTRKQLSKLGGTLFICEELKIDWTQPYFLTIKECNEYRRELIALLEKERIRQFANQQTLNYKSTIAHLQSKIENNSVPYPAQHLDYSANVSNKKAEAFYRRHGVKSIDPAFEKQNKVKNAVVMTMKHCLRFQYDLCAGRNAVNVEPLYLEDARNRYRLEFDCQQCQMKVVVE
jgi:23S rRNA 5-hydroxycytidine C2501 synthase